MFKNRLKPKSTGEWCNFEGFFVIKLSGVYAKEFREIWNLFIIFTQQQIIDRKIEIYSTNFKDKYYESRLDTNAIAHDVMKCCWETWLFKANCSKMAKQHWDLRWNDIVIYDARKILFHSKALAIWNKLLRQVKGLTWNVFELSMLGRTWSSVSQKILNDQWIDKYVQIL